MCNPPQDEGTLGPDDKIMIFTLTRAAAGNLAEYINHHNFTTGDNGFKPRADYIVGHGFAGSSDYSMTSKEQIEASQRFKGLLATSLHSPFFTDIRQPHFLASTFSTTSLTLLSAPLHTDVSTQTVSLMFS